MSNAEPRDLRLCALAVSILYDVDITPGDHGVVLTGDAPVAVPWAECLEALGGVDPDSAAGRSRLAGWLFARRRIAMLSPVELGERIRPVGLPRHHSLHPGSDWVREAVLGQALDLGLGLAGPDRGPGADVMIVAPGAWTVAGIDAASLWPQARAYLTSMGRLAAMRVGRGRPDVLRPMGDCDVVTLLGARDYRRSLAGREGGMMAVAVPMRSRGWIGLRAIDPAFAVAAASATEPDERGFEGPLLVTGDEVTLVARLPVPTYR
ncbi:MAG: hypothetical protein WCB04_11425 [Mycobacteriales bacterium]